MSTYNEVVNMVLDELKLVSDDSFIQREHIIFLLDKYRSFILKKMYTDIKKEIPESNFQTICLDLEPHNAFDNDSCGNETYLRSKQEIPTTIPISYPKVSTMDYAKGNITYVNRERFKYVGNNKYLQNFIYSTIYPDSHLYIKSTNPQFQYLKQVKFSGVFEDSAKASELACDQNTEGKCDIMDRDYPLEEALIPQVIELILKELSGIKYTPEDKENNAKDDLSDIAGFLRQHLSYRSPLYSLLGGTSKSD